MKRRRVVALRAAKVCIPLSPFHDTPFYAEGVLFSDGGPDSQDISIAEEVQITEQTSEPDQEEKDLKYTQIQAAPDNSPCPLRQKLPCQGES